MNIDEVSRQEPGEVFTELKRCTAKEGSRYEARRIEADIRRVRTVRRHIATTALMLAILSIGPPVFAQMAVRVNIPGTAFSPERGSEPVTIEDVGSGRRFRGKAFSLVKLRGTIQLPPSSAADPKMQRLVIHFRTSPSGPSLRSVELLGGSSTILRIETHLEGDYTVKETLTPAVIANAWAYRDPVKVSAQSVLRLEVQFPGGFDSQIDPGEFFLTSVSVDFPRKLPDSVDLDTSGRYKGLQPPATITKPPLLPAMRNGVIYALASTNELLWYGHTGWKDGSLGWAATQGKQVGRGWDFKQVFSGGNGVIYAITSTGDLLWYRHDGRGDGSFRWGDPQGSKIGTAWNFQHVFSGGGGVIYAITASGDLLWYRHDGHLDGSAKWAAPAGKTVGVGWAFNHVFSGGDGVIYAVASNNDLLWYRHDGNGDGSVRWAAPSGKKVGAGWAVKQAFSGGDGVIYAVMPNGDLLWNRHEGRDDGSFRWAEPNGKKVGSGWNFKDVFSGELPGR